ncbi:MAG: hypothetical protein ACNA8N_06315 [Trueperaceae bacterium]
MRDHADPDASAGLRDGLAALLRPDQIDTSPSALDLTRMDRILEIAA